MRQGGNMTTASKKINEKIKAIFLGTVLQLDNMLNVAFDVSETEDSIITASGTIRGVELVISTDGCEIQCKYNLDKEKDAKWQLKVEAIIQASSDRPRAINAETLERTDWEKIPGITRDFASSTASFLLILANP